MDDDRRAARRVAREPVGVGIARQQRALEEHDRHRPYRRRAAQARQHHLGEHRLHHEQQRGADEDGRRDRCEQEEQVTSGRRARRRVVRRQVGYSHNCCPDFEVRTPCGLCGGRTVGDFCAPRQSVHLRRGEITVPGRACRRPVLIVPDPR